jgi:hypothetical protein
MMGAEVLMDRFYNERAAAWARDLVMKMDEGEAQEFVKHVTRAVLLEDIANNQRTIDAHVMEIQKSLLYAADRVVSKGRLSPVDVVVDVSKAFDPNRPRDAHGQFSRTESRHGKKLQRKARKLSAAEQKAYFNLVATLNSRGAQASQFSNSWLDAGRDTPGTNDRTYRRIQSGSQLLGDVTTGPGGVPLPGMGKVATAAKFGEFVGRYGPEAEKVIGPHARKTAYRYRGTERTPDSELIGMRNDRVKAFAVPESDLSVQQIAARRALGPAAGVSPEQKINASVTAATTYLGRRLPSLRLAEIQTKSGKIPPSEGVIVDRDGKVSHQAIGFAEDHYLPFNLKNLSDLKDGTYVRTRTKGGLSTEDIYTGLVSGAREVTVVSNSGVFTIEFEDDFRGVRRFNDKAAGMVDRYAKTLDAIKHGEIEREPLSPEEKAYVRSEVEAEYAGMPRREIEEEITSRIKEQRSDTSLSERELKLIDAQAGAMAGAGDRGARDVNRVRQDLIDDATEAKRTRMYQLDGEGYAAAMESLKEQYPYYIKSVSFMTKRQAMGHDGERSDKGFQGGIPDRQGRLKQFTTATDSGYVKARHNRPDDVKEGYYDTTIAGTGKQNASTTNYQNWEHNPLRGGLRPVEGGQTKVPEARAGSALQQARQERAKIQVERSHKQALQSVLTAYSGVNLNGAHPIIARAVSDYDAVYADPATRKDLETALLAVHEGIAKQPDTASFAQANEAAVRALKTESGRSGGIPWTREHLGTKGASPYSFSEPAYQIGAQGSTVTKEMNKHLATLRTGGITDPEKLNDGQLASIAVSSGIMANVLSQGTLGDRGKHELAQLAVEIGAPEGWEGSQIRHIENSDDPAKEAAKWAAKAEAAERIRRLIVNGVPAEYGAGVAPPVPVPKQLPKTLSAPEAADMLKNAAKEIEDPPEQDDWHKMALLMQKGQIGEARKLAQALNENDPTRQGLLKVVFPDIDEPW